MDEYIGPYVIELPANTEQILWSDVLLLIVGSMKPEHFIDRYSIMERWDQYLDDAIRNGDVVVTKPRSNLRDEMVIDIVNLRKLAAANGLSVAAPTSDTPADTQPELEPPIGVKTSRHKLRTNSLDAPIEKAIAEAASLETAAVHLKLKELAISGELPFTGLVECDALCYTNKNDKPAKLTWNALDHRLRLRRKAANNRG